MLKQVIDAQLPLVAVSTRDVMNLPEVIRELTKKTPIAFSNSGVKIEKGKVYMMVVDPKAAVPFTQLYEKMTGAESTLLVVNPPKVVEPMFDAGEVPVPRSLLIKFLTHVVDNKDKAEQLLRGLGGCTIKEAAELARLTMVRDKSLTVQGLVATRKSFFQGQSGLTIVDTRQAFYQAPQQLVDWVQMESDFFLHGSDPRLIPRGLLFDGPPGTGKTAGAKWLADKLDVPLYRVDVGATKNKYMGASEANMLSNLQRLDAEEPCVALLDEIEKVFGGSGDMDGNTTTTMLSQLLWWLAERRSRVLVVMTTNNAKKLPKELYRDGRIDASMWFGGLPKADADKFVGNLLATFPGVKATASDVSLIVAGTPITKDPYTSANVYTPATLTGEVYRFIKKAKKNT